MGQTLPEASLAGTPIALPNPESVALGALPDKAIRDLLLKDISDQGALAARGRKEAEIYRNASPAVVLVVTTKGMGSGSYLGNGLVLTNWHVVTPATTVGVLFKPSQEGAPLDPKSIVRADVTKTDPTRDLALLKLALAPQSLRPLELANEKEIEVGADVHAIGHPIGEIWTYTRGLISQVRKDYVWKTKDDTVEHRAEVIQTQTPISPGNSGGPLLGDSGKILGINSFGQPKGENLNFAVSVREIAAFIGAGPQMASLSQPAKPVANASAPPRVRGCEPVTLYDGRTCAKDGRVVSIDTNCDGKPDFYVYTPDDQTKPIEARIDRNHDGRIDMIVQDQDRDGRWDVSYIDVDFDGTPDLVGYHPDGRLEPSRFQQYAAN